MAGFMPFMPPVNSRLECSTASMGGDFAATSMEADGFTLASSSAETLGGRAGDAVARAAPSGMTRSQSRSRSLL